MLSRVRQWLDAQSSNDDGTEGVEEHRRHAIALLLLETARADFDTAMSESRTIEDILCDDLGLEQADARRLIGDAGETLDEKVSLHATLDHINDGFDADSKRDLIHWMWQVAYADGRLDPHEEAVIRRLADLLYIPHEDFIRTKLRHQDKASGDGPDAA